jgi:hypothetical protein
MKHARAGCSNSGNAINAQTRLCVLSSSGYGKDSNVAHFLTFLGTAHTHTTHTF